MLYEICMHISCGSYLSVEKKVKRDYEDDGHHIAAPHDGREDSKARRHLLFLGTCPGLPESPLHAEARAAHSVLNTIVTLAHESSANTRAGPAGAFHGLDLLHLASAPKPVTTPRWLTSQAQVQNLLRQPHCSIYAKVGRLLSAARTAP